MIVTRESGQQKSTLEHNRVVRAFLACRQQLERMVSRLVPPHEIEDILQETYVRACQFNPRPGTELKKPQALMVTIARNLALDHLKSADQRLVSRIGPDLDSLLAQDSGQFDATMNAVSSDEEFSRFCEAVRQLPLQRRKVFVLKRVYGYSQREIAHALGLSESTVEKHVAHGFKSCAQFLAENSSTSAAAAGAIHSKSALK